MYCSASNSWYTPMLLCNMEPSTTPLSWNRFDPPFNNGSTLSLAPYTNWVWVWQTHCSNTGSPNNQYPSLAIHWCKRQNTAVLLAWIIAYQGTALWWGARLAQAWQMICTLGGPKLLVFWLHSAFSDTMPHVMSLPYSQKQPSNATVTMQVSSPYLTRCKPQPYLTLMTLWMMIVTSF